MHAYSPGICEVDAEALKAKASLAAQDSSKRKNKNRADNRGLTHEGSVTTWQQGQRLRQSFNMPRSTEGGSHEEIGGGLRWIFQKAPTQPTPCSWTVTGAGLCPSTPTEHTLHDFKDQFLPSPHLFPVLPQLSLAS